MPIHFSIGFVVEQSPRRGLISVCGTANTETVINAIWKRSRNCGAMNCQCSSCVSRGYICVPRGNSMRVIFTVDDSVGDPFDVSDAAEIEFIVSTGTMFNGSIMAGGSVLFSKKLTDGEVVFGGLGELFAVDIDPSDSVTPTRSLNYYEVNVTTSSGQVYTISAGVYQADKTIVGSL